jgi:hypothetical protein
MGLLDWPTSGLGAGTPQDNLNNMGECFKAGPWAVDVEIRRALNNVESHPLGAVHNAGSVLEASFKPYLDHHKVTDTLSKTAPIISSGGRISNPIACPALSLAENRPREEQGRNGTDR